MSSLLTLAKDLELKSKKQQQSTDAMLKAAFSGHEQCVIAELNASARRISSVISDHESLMNDAMQSNRQRELRMVGRTWLTITMVSVLLLASLSGVLWYQGSRIAENLEEIGRQKEALSALRAQTWGVTYREDSKGRFLVLPKGTDGEPGWTVGEGKVKQNAVKLVKE